MIDLFEFVCGPCLQPENLLLDSQGSLKISDFGLSALPEPVLLLISDHIISLTLYYITTVSLVFSFIFLQGVNVLRTTCGTPNYVAPEVLMERSTFIIFLYSNLGSLTNVHCKVRLLATRAIMVHLLIYGPVV